MSNLSNTDKEVLQHYNDYGTPPEGQGLKAWNIQRSEKALLNDGLLSPASKNGKVINQKGIEALKAATHEQE